MSGTAPVCSTAPGDAGASIAITVQWQGVWDEVAAPALIERFDEADDTVDVEVLPALPAPEGVGALLGDAPPTLARVPAEAVATLAAADAIRPMDPCVAEQLGSDDELAAAAAMGAVDGTRYGVAGNVDAAVLVYDATAFAADPPATWAELEAVAPGLPAPIAGFAPALSVADVSIGEELPDGARVWTALRDAGLLLDPGDDGALPPLGDGRAAAHIVRASDLWGYASGLAEGQAPDADLRVAALPGAEGPVVALSGDVWVIAAAATDGEAAAATALLSWLVSAPQQATLQTLTDLYPTTRAAAGDPAAVAYGHEFPLLADAWAVIALHAVAAPWATLPGATPTVGGAIAQSGWSGLTDVFSAAADVDPVDLLACTYPAHEPPVPLTACVE